MHILRRSFTKFSALLHFFLHSSRLDHVGSLKRGEEIRKMNGKLWNKESERNFSWIRCIGCGVISCTRSCWTWKLCGQERTAPRYQSVVAPPAMAYLPSPPFSPDAGYEPAAGSRIACTTPNDTRGTPEWSELEKDWKTKQQYKNKSLYARSE